MNRQEKINELLKALTNGKNWNPNITEIGKQIGMPVSTVHDILKKIQHRGALKIKISIALDKKKLEEKRMVI